MLITCEDCDRKFKLNEKYLVMLSESIKINKRLKIVCSNCGWNIIRNDQLKDV